MFLYSEALKKLISELPSMTEQELTAADELGTPPPPHTRNKLSVRLNIDHLLDSACPICFVPFSAILAEHEMAAAMDTPAHPVEALGITRLSKTCGHIFCRRE